LVLELEREKRVAGKWQKRKRLVGLILSKTIDKNISVKMSL